MGYVQNSKAIIKVTNTSGPQSAHSPPSASHTPTTMMSASHELLESRMPGKTPRRIALKSVCPSTPSKLPHSYLYIGVLQ